MQNSKCDAKQDKAFRVVVIGAGMIANKAHIPAFQSLGEQVRLVGVADANPEAAQGTAERWGIPGWYTDPEAMIKELQPDLVSVCSPNASHKKMVELALNGGAHVLCEKPLALTYADTKVLFDLAKEKGLGLMACQVMRYNERFAATKELAGDGMFGNIYFSEINLVRRRGIPKWGTFHLKEANGGGAFCDLGVHMIDTVLWLMGGPAFESISGSMASVIARNERDVVTSLAESGAPAGVNSARPYDPSEFEVEEFAAGSLRVAGGANINFKISWAVNLPPEFRIQLAGEKAGISLPDMEMYATLGRRQVDIVPRMFGEGRFAHEPFAGHFYLVEDFVAWMRGEGPMPVDPAETLNVAAVIDAFYVSAEAGREVRASEIVN